MTTVRASHFGGELEGNWRTSIFPEEFRSSICSRGTQTKYAFSPPNSGTYAHFERVEQVAKRTNTYQLKSMGCALYFGEPQG